MKRLIKLNRKFKGNNGIEYDNPVMQINIIGIDYNELFAEEIEDLDNEIISTIKSKYDDYVIKEIAISENGEIKILFNYLLPNENMFSIIDDINNELNNLYENVRFEIVNGFVAP